MAEGAQCGEEGPFFPTTPRNVIQNGISINDAILITPDWLLIGLMLACFFIVVLIIVLALVSSSHFYFKIHLRIMDLNMEVFLNPVLKPKPTKGRLLGGANVNLSHILVNCLNYKSKSILQRRSEKPCKIYEEVWQKLMPY